MMTLDCKQPRRLCHHPTLSHSTSRLPEPVPHSTTYRLQTQQQQQQQRLEINNDNSNNIMNSPSLSLSKRRETGSHTGDSFLQRLMAIEKLHDEKRKARQTAETKQLEKLVRREPVADQDPPGFPRSPTRWISEQILDDTRDMDELRSLENKKIFYKSAYSRLPSLSGVHRMSSSCTDVSNSSIIPPASQTECSSNSLSSLSYLEINRNDETNCSRSSRPVQNNKNNYNNVRKRPLRLPPILLPPIFSVRPRPLKERDFLTPTQTRGPITDEEWDDLRQCRYIRPAPPRFALPLSSSQLSLL